MDAALDVRNCVHSPECAAKNSRDEKSRKTRELAQDVHDIQWKEL